MREVLRTYNLFKTLDNNNDEKSKFDEIVEELCDHLELKSVSDDVDVNFSQIESMLEEVDLLRVINIGSRSLEKERIRS